MTLRDSSVQPGTRKGDRNLGGRLRDKRRRKDRRLLSETLEQRQLLAGPDLVGIQPNDGQLIRGGEVLNVSPRELIFRFDDQSDLDPLTIASGISIWVAPEGRRSETGAIGKLKKGGFHLAIDSKTPIVPLAISHTNKVLAKNSLSMNYDVPIRVVLGEPIASADRSIEELMSEVEAFLHANVTQ